MEYINSIGRIWHNSFTVWIYAKSRLHSTSSFHQSPSEISVFENILFLPSATIMYSSSMLPKQSSYPAYFHTPLTQSGWSLIHFTDFFPSSLQPFWPVINITSCTFILTFSIYIISWASHDIFFSLSPIFPLLHFRCSELPAALTVPDPFLRYQHRLYWTITLWRSHFCFACSWTDRPYRSIWIVDWVFMLPIVYWSCSYACVSHYVEKYTIIIIIIIVEGLKHYLE